MSYATRLTLTLTLGLLVVATSTSVAQSPLPGPEYDKLKKSFLTIDPAYYDEYVIADQFGDVKQDFPKVDGRNKLELTIKEGGYKGWWTFGGSYWCKNSLHGVNSLCRLATGGTPHNNGPICGSTVDNDYQTALNCPQCICPEQFGAASGIRLWIGAGSNKNYITPLFPKLSNAPVNRLCVEFEVPVDRVKVDGAASRNLEIAEVANPEVSHDNLDWLEVEWGTYTSVYKGDTYTNDEETGGSFQGGDAHYYHNGWSRSPYPMDRIFAVSENTFVACMGTAPSSVRSGSRPSYGINPLLTVVGENEQGVTDAYQYIPYVARVYFDIHGYRATHPYTVKYNKVFALYEPEDIFAMNLEGSVLGVDIVEDNQSAQHPFTIYNNAPEQRTYRVTMTALGNVPLSKPSDTFRVFIDDNGNRQKDPEETRELLPYQTVTLPARQDLKLVAIVKASSTAYGMNQRYERKFLHAGVTLQEVGRMRMTSYATRTWIGSKDDVNNKISLLKSMVYQTPQSEYAVYRQWNQDKPNNNRLIRATPDFKMARQKLLSLPTDTTPPTAPGQLRASPLSPNQVELTWTKSLEKETWVNHYNVYRDGTKVGEIGGRFITERFVDPALIGSTTYRYQVTGVNRSGTESARSDTITVTTPTDSAPPTISAAASSIENPKSVTVTFSEPITRDTAESVSNYSIVGGSPSLISAVLSADGRTVTLTASQPMVNAPYVLRVNGIRDRSSAAHSILPNSEVTFTVPALVDFGPSIDETTPSRVGINSYGVADWNIPFFDTYNLYMAVPGGLSGTTFKSQYNGAYDYQGVAGAPRNFSVGDAIVVTWYNNTDGELRFIPRIAFDNQGRLTKDTSNLMTEAVIPPRSSTTTTYIVDESTKGVHSAINVANTLTKVPKQSVICDKIELRVGGGSFALPPPGQEPPAPPTGLRIVGAK